MAVSHYPTEQIVNLTQYPSAQPSTPCFILVGSLEKVLCSRLPTEHGLNVVGNESAFSVC